MSDARNSILTKLRTTRDAHPLTPPPSDFASIEAKHWAPEERLPRIRRLMEAVHTEFLDATEADWPVVLREFLAREGVGSLLYAPATEAGKRLVEGWKAESPSPPRGEGRGEGEASHDSPEGPATNPPHPNPLPGGERGSAPGPVLIPYDRPFEDIKPQLFESIEAGLTTTRGAIAETGSLILWPSADEPRTLSLVPHIHVAILRTDALYDTFLQAIREQGWARDMPTNALLVSGPSKTADIEQTLAYGVHGPKRLVVLVVHP
ncbi:lactate utilization protein [Azospirillum sp. TSH20]|uniref:LutC/YkgG family protein n=1 Tax=Azospirillum sp. TSH20 TaxID=652754 RepID=UPI000D61D81D|nr:lactate utilization protein [Azospirillum sp. TSH20]PWC70007.1 lactate utilization protein B/C [Azospirillum sp. TSH20]